MILRVKTLLKMKHNDDVHNEVNGYYYNNNNLDNNNTGNNNVNNNDNVKKECALQLMGRR